MILGLKKNHFKLWSNESFVRRKLLMQCFKVRQGYIYPWSPPIKGREKIEFISPVLGLNMRTSTLIVLLIGNCLLLVSFYVLLWPILAQFSKYTPKILVLWHFRILAIWQWTRQFGHTVLLNLDCFNVITKQNLSIYHDSVVWLNYCKMLILSENV